MSPHRPPAREAGQLRLPLSGGRKRHEVEAVSVGRRVVMVRLVRHRRARRYVLRVLVDGSVRVTVPPFGSRTRAMAFLQRELAWVDSQRYALARSAGTILFRGETLALMSDASASTVSFGDQCVEIRRGESARQAANRRLRAIAARELRGRLHALAGRFGLHLGRVTIRGQQTRWGSCSPGGAIALNWRLVQTPDAVRDYILIHELMHLREPNHSRRFWTLVEHACPEHGSARKWLQAHERDLL